MMMNQQKGFTLIELMIVVAIIGILVSVSIPNYHPLRDQVKMSEAKIFANQYKKDVLEYYNYTGRFPINNQVAGMVSADKIQGQYVQSVTIDHGAIHVRMKEAKFYEPAKHQVFSLFPVLHQTSSESPVLWLNALMPLPEGYMFPSKPSDSNHNKGV